jgi:hypothetical protein
MKKQLHYFLNATTFSILLLSSIIAQADRFEEPSHIIPTTTSPDKKLNLNIKIKRSFIQYFEDATNQRWFESDKNFLVKFNMNGLENRALFAGDGRLIYHITYGTEKNLPANVRSLIKSTYYDQAITRILKVTQDHRLIWVIHLEDNHEYIMARVEDNELEETKRMLKTE